MTTLQLDARDATPEDLADAFWNLGSDEQARFYNRLAEVTRDAPFPMQLQAITDDDGLTLAGRRVMEAIGEYSHWGLVPHCDPWLWLRDWEARNP